MARLPRNIVPGIPVHLVHRGNNRQPIFLSDSDYLAMLRFIEIAREKCGVAVHSYVLMPNHFHLVATTEAAGGISKFVQSVARRYVGYFNSFYQRTGTLWEGRFHSSSIESDYYLLACHRYIDMNPVRARLVPHPAEYPWSSHRHYVLGASDSILTPHPLVEAIARDPDARARAYERLFDELQSDAELDAIRSATSRREPLRCAKFVSDTSFPRGQGAGQATARS